MMYKNADLDVNTATFKASVSTNNIPVNGYVTEAIVGVGGRIAVAPKQSITIEGNYMRTLESPISGAEVYSTALIGAVGYTLELQ